MKRAILQGLAAAALVVAVVAGIASLFRTRDLERRLDEANRRAAVLDRQARESELKFDKALKAATSAQQGAQAAAEDARAAAAGRASAEAGARTAKEARERAEADARQSRQELADLQQRREQELDRMKEALARIAATRRTGSGLVIDLSSDSFHFDFDKATLSQENRELLSRIAGVLLASNGYRLYVYGHTDDVGTDEYNQDLSERRADNVASYLESAGIASDVVEARGFGKASPRVKGTTAAARRENRRVEIVLVDSVIHYEGVVPVEGRG